MGISMEAQKEAILEKSKKTMSVPEMRRLLGLKKTDSYWLVHRNFFQTLRLQDAAALAGVTSGTITKWIQMGHFSSAGAGKALRIHWNEFLKWLKEYQEGV